MSEVYNAKSMIVLLKRETTYKTDAVPTGAANALQLENVAFTPMTAEELKREWIRSGYGEFPTDFTNMGASLTGELVMVGGGGLGNIPYYDDLMRIVGWASQNTAGVKHEYKLISEGFESGSLYVHRGSSTSGLVHKLLGTRGKWTSIKVDANGYLRIGVELLSLYASPVSSVMPANVNYGHANMAAALPVNDVNSDFTLDGYAAVLHSLELSSGMNVKNRDLINDNSVRSNGRAITGQLVIDEPPLASKDYWSVVKNRTKVAIQLVQGVTAGEVVQLDASKVQLGIIELGDADGDATMGFPVACLPADEGDDNDLIITVK
jgi:hypothetical protein